MAHAPGVSFLSALRVRVLSVLSLSVSLSLSLSCSPLSLLLHPLSRARSISYSFLLRVPLSSLATFALVRPPHRRVRTRGTRLSLVPLSAYGSHARTLAAIILVVLSSGRLRIRAAGVSRDPEERSAAGSTKGKGYPEIRSSVRFSLLLQSRRNPARAGSNYGELTYLPQRGGLRSFGRRRARSCEKRPES